MVIACLHAFQEVQSHRHCQMSMFCQNTQWFVIALIAKANPRPSATKIKTWPPFAHRMLARVQIFERLHMKIGELRLFQV